MRAVQKRVIPEDEASVERHLIKRVKALKGLAIKVMFLTGWPDRMVLLPGGRIVWFELKRPKGGRFQPLQPYWIKTLRKLGFGVYVCKTKQEVDEVLDAIT
jgi:hypothetical protein